MMFVKLYRYQIMNKNSHTSGQADDTPVIKMCLFVNEQQGDVL